MAFSLQISFATLSAMNRHSHITSNAWIRWAMIAKVLRWEDLQWNAGLQRY